MKNKIYDKTMDYIFKTLVFIIKNMFKLVLSTFKTSLKFKKVLNTKIHKVIYCLSIIIPCIYIWMHNLHPALYFFTPFVYFFMENLRQELIAHQKNTRIKILNAKHKKICLMFDNKLDVLSVKKDIVLLYSTELTEKDIQSKLHRLEIYFNRKIAIIQQQENNLRVYAVKFLVKSRFKDKYLFDEYINYIKPSNINKMILPFVMGIDEAENIHLEDLTKLCHVFISGESNTGKSCFLNQFIQSLMVFRNNILQFYLVDLKEGIEMSDYLGFKNCLIISNVEELIKIIKHLDAEMTKRLNIIKNTKYCKDILQYNKNTSAKMNFIIFIVDEFATIKLNGDSKEIEQKFISILQKGRAAGIYCIGATQRPSSEQINTNIRAGFLFNISLRVKTKETQRMTKILGTELLKVGEFKTDILDKTLKTLFIDELTNNRVFEDLEFCCVDGKEFIQIKEKDFSQLSFYKRLCQYIDMKLYKRRTVNRPMLIDYVRFIKPPTKDIMTEIEAVKKAYDIDILPLASDIFQKTDGFELFMNYLFVNSKDGFLPQAKEIESNLDLSRFKRLKYQKRAIDEGYILELSKSKFRLIDKEE